MLLIAERGWIDRGEPAHDGERCDLRLRREPALDRRQMRIELGRHAYPFLVTPFWPAMCGAHLGGLGRRAERSRKPEWIGRDWVGRRCKTALADPLAELVLCRADLGQQRHRIETAIGLAQPPLDGLGQLGMSQRSLVRRRRHVIALDDLCALATLLPELERRLEEVHVQTRRRVKTRHHAGRLYSVKAAVADQTTYHRAVLLLHERLVVLLVGPRARHLDLLFSTPRHDHVVHECAVVVEVGTTDQPWEQALRPRHRLDDEAAVTCHQRQALRPPRRDIHHRQRLDERARHARAAVRNHVDLTEASPAEIVGLRRRCYHRSRTGLPWPWINASFGDRRVQGSRAWRGMQSRWGGQFFVVGARRLDGGDERLPADRARTRLHLTIAGVSTVKTDRPQQAAVQQLFQRGVNEYEASPGARCR